MTNSIEFGYICKVIWSYIKYVFSSKSIPKQDENFDFFKQIFHSTFPAVVQVEEYRNKLLNCNEVIQFQDFGAGSRKFKSNHRIVKEIAKTSGTPIKYIQVLTNLCNTIDDCQVLELGTSLGIGTLGFALSANQITTVEGDTETYKFTRKQLSNHKNINFVHSLFDDFIEKDLKPYDVYFIDGNHTKQATIKYAFHLLKSANTGAYFVLDDINWSKGMQEAWEKIKTSGDFDLSIDIFKFGVLRVGNGPTNHYKIRY